VGRSVSGVTFDLSRASRSSSLDGDAFGEIPRLVDVAAELDGEVVGEELQGNHGRDGADVIGDGGDADDVVGDCDRRLCRR
jgi:hypothetical protein